MSRGLARSVLGIAVVVAVVAGVFVLARPSITEDQVRRAVTSTIETESPAAFVVTGRLEINVETRIEDSRVLLPGIVGLDLGTTRATVRLPGTVSYGFPADSLRPAMVRLTETGMIELELPTLVVYSAEPDLAAMEVETERGWARLPGGAEAVERQALGIIEGALRRQGAAHLAASFQPRINTAWALQRLLRPALQGLGMEDPRFRFRLGDGLVVEPSR